jgi:hypothetical protein
MIEMEKFFLCLGYTCACGEKVTVFRLPINFGIQDYISSKTVTCMKGHTRSVTIDQLATLDHWVEKIEDEELKTGT